MLKRLGPFVFWASMAVVLHAAPATNLAISGGNGQLVPEYNLASQPLSVLVTDSSGAPVSNAAVSWQLTAGSATVQVPSSLSDSNGIAQTTFVASQVPAGYSFLPNTVTASLPNGAHVNFTVTTFLFTLPGGVQAAAPLIQLLKPTVESNQITIKSGQTLAGAIQASIVAAAGLQSGQPIPGVGMRFSTPEGGPRAACVNGALSDSSGVVNCDLMVTGTPGQYLSKVIVGEAVQFSILLIVQPPDSVVLRPDQGNAQTGNPGDTLPLTLVITALNGSGAPIANLDVAWSVISGTATLVNTVSRTDSAGHASTQVKLGFAGTSTIRATSGTATATFTVNAAAGSTGGTTVVSGSGQSALAGALFALPLVVRVTDGNNSPVSGATVTFQVTNGSATLSSSSAVTNANGQAQVNVTAGLLAGGVTVVAGTGSGATASFQLTVISTGTSTALLFVPVNPCRVLDTRLGSSPFNPGSPLAAGETRSISIGGSRCNIPSTAQAYSLNVTVVPRGSLGYLTLWPTGNAKPFVSTLNSFDGSIVANAALVPAGTNGAVSVFATDATDLVLDINGYFTSSNAVPSYAFYPATPCRVVDTRNPSGVFGGPSLAAAQPRTFPLVASAACTVNASAKAYSLNATVVPAGGLGYLSLWPSGSAQPEVSTLNSAGGRVLANAALVPVGINGGIDTYATDRTDLILDLNGTFASPGGAGALSFYPVTPCRAVDTRNPDGAFGGPILSAGSTRTFQISAGSCGIPANARAFSLNVTVVPQEFLGYLTLRPATGNVPLVSTLNSMDARVVANAAIVPADSSGAIAVTVTGKTHVILDINGYFAP